MKRGDLILKEISHQSNPRGLRYQAEYIPDMDKMVKALEIVRELPAPEKDSPSTEGDLKEGA